MLSLNSPGDHQRQQLCDYFPEPASWCGEEWSSADGRVSLVCATLNFPSTFWLNWSEVPFGHVAAVVSDTPVTPGRVLLWHLAFLDLLPHKHLYHSSSLSVSSNPKVSHIHQPTESHLSSSAYCMPSMLSLQHTFLILETQHLPVSSYWILSKHVNMQQQHHHIDAKDDAWKMMY